VCDTSQKAKPTPQDFPLVCLKAHKNVSNMRSKRLFDMRFALYKTKFLFEDLKSDSSQIHLSINQSFISATTTGDYCLFHSLEKEACLSLLLVP
jgi:hypothetical protein